MEQFFPLPLASQGEQISRPSIPREPKGRPKRSQLDSENLECSIKQKKLAEARLVVEYANDLATLDHELKYVQELKEKAEKEKKG